MRINKVKSSGQGMTEYLIIVALMAISAVAVIRITSSSMKIGFGKVANALQGKEEATGTQEQVNDSDVKGRNLSDFNTGVVPSGN